MTLPIVIIILLMQSVFANAACPLITSTGTYTMTDNSVGAPYNVSEVITNYFACVKIASSNVTFDCAGHSITGDGTNASASAWIGIVLNGSLTNVTVKNCPAISNYTFGIYAYQSNNSVFTNNTAYNNTYDSFEFNSNCNNNTITNNTAYNNTYDGFFFYSSANNNTLINNTAYNNSIHGFLIYNSSNNTLINNTASNNFYYGFYLYLSSNNNSLVNNTAYHNSDGFYLNLSSSNNLINNTAYNNSDAGFYLDSSSGNNLTNNTAYNNPWDNFYLYACSNNILSGNTAHSSDTWDGIFLDSSPGNILMDNVAYNNTNQGFVVLNSSNNIFADNTAYNNSNDGFLILDDSSNNNLTNNTAYGNLWGFMFFTSSNNNTLTNNTAYNNTRCGVLMQNSTDISMAGQVFYNNAYDFLANGSTGGASFEMENSYFLNPRGTYANYTILSINDSVDAGTSYYINWSASPDTFPDQRLSFAGTYFDIANLSGAVSIDSVVWSWPDEELAGYNENGFELWERNATDWTLLNDAPDTSSNTLSLTDLSPSSGFGILERDNCPLITSPGTYRMSNNYLGAPNDASPDGVACVKIASSDVVFDCAGYNITDNDTGGTRIGVVISGSLGNVTVRNCPGISDYGYGVYSSATRDSFFTNITVYNNSDDGFFMVISTDNVLMDDVSRDNGYYGFYLYWASNGNNLTNNTASGNGQEGFFSFSSNSNNLVNNTAHGNLDGFKFRQSTGNTLINNTACDNDANGFYFHFHSDDNIVVNNTSHDNGEYAFLAELVSESVFTGNTGYSNGVDGFDFISDPSGHLFDNQISGNTAYWNGDTGFYFMNGTHNNVTDNVAYENVNYGYDLDRGFNGNTFANNSGYRNGVDGVDFAIGSENLIVYNQMSSNNDSGMYFLESVNNIVSNNSAYDNQNLGIQVDSDSDNNNLSGNIVCRNGNYGIYISSSMNNNLTNSIAYENGLFGFLVESGSNNNLTNDTAYDNYGEGFGFISDSDNNLVFDNNAYDNANNGFLVNSSSDNVMSGNSIHDNGADGIYIFGSDGTGLDSNEIYNNALSGVDAVASDGLTMSRDHLYNNALDFIFNDSLVEPLSLSLSEVVFDNPAGDYTSYTNLSLDDTTDGDAYSITWVSNETLLPLPHGHFSFAQKFVDITPLAGDVSIDSVVWHWTDSEAVSPYDDTRFGLWDYNGTSWVSMPATLDTDANTLSASDVADFSGFAILQAPPSQSSSYQKTTASPLSISFNSSCAQNTVTVSSRSSDVAGADVVVDDPITLMTYASGTTDDAGLMRFNGCGRTLRVSATKSGYEKADATVELVSCGQCAPVGCACGRIQDNACVEYQCCSDDQCPQGQSCTGHVCKLKTQQPECTAPVCCASDDQCPATQKCSMATGASNGSCQEIAGCGKVENHKLAPYQCGAEAGCPSCPSGQTCTAHKCVGSDLKAPVSAYVDTIISVQASEGGAPCKACELQIADPAGKSSIGTTDGNGSFNLTLNLPGVYAISLIKDGHVIKTIQVNSLPKATPGEGAAPAAAGAGDLLLVGIIVLLVLIAAGIYAASRHGKKK